MKLLDVVSHARTLTKGAPYAVIGGLAQILWARKTHTDDLDIALAAKDLEHAYESVRTRKAPKGWRLPKPPDLAHEQDEIFEVYHLLFRGAVVDLLRFEDAELTSAIIDTARVVPELSNIRFVRPELLLVMHLLRPGPEAALAAIELIVARRALGGFDVAYARRWANRLGRGEALRRALSRADDLSRA